MIGHQVSLNDFLRAPGLESRALSSTVDSLNTSHSFGSLLHLFALKSVNRAAINFFSISKTPVQTSVGHAAVHRWLSSNFSIEVVLFTNELHVTVSLGLGKIGNDSLDIRDDGVEVDVTSL
jgi:hypothetical protein